MKKYYFLLLAFCLTAMANAQCPEAGTVVPTAKIMNASSAKDYTDCDVTIEASFIFSSVSGYKHPGTFKKSVVFQVSPIGEEDNYRDARGQRGLFVAIPKEGSDAIFELSKGDRLELRGHTYVKYGIVYFVASSYKKE